jgi:hypothetical protein
MCHIPTTVQCSNAVRSNPKKLPNEIPMSFNTGTCDMQAMNMKDLTPITYPPNILPHKSLVEIPQRNPAEEKSISQIL